MDQPAVKALWDVFEEFHRARCLFEQVHRRLRRETAALSKPMSPEVLLKVFDRIGMEALQVIRDRHVAVAAERLRDAATSVKSAAVSLLLALLSVIYHRLSILFEHHGTLKESGGREEAEEMRRLAVRYIEETYRLFRRAEREMEKVARSLRAERLFIRSLFLYADGVVRDRELLREIYRRMYAGGIAHGYIEAAEDFHKSGFHTRAREALERARRSLRAARLAEGLKTKLTGRLGKLSAEVDAAIKQSLEG